MLRRIALRESGSTEWKEIIPSVDEIHNDGKHYTLSLQNGHQGVFVHKYNGSGQRESHYNALPDGRGVIDLDGRRFEVELKERASHSAKYTEVERIAQEVVFEKKEKLVVFSGVVKAVEDMGGRLRGVGIKTLEITGYASRYQRDAILKEFQSSREPVVLLCTYQTLGESVDLVAAHYGILVDSPWDDRDQIIRRMYRIGQEHDVRFFILQARNTIDEHIEQVNWEADMIQKIVLDGSGAMYKANEAMVGAYLSLQVNREKEMQQLQFFRERVKGLLKRRKVSEYIAAIVVEQTGSGGTISFNGKSLVGRIVGKNGMMETVNGIDDLLRRFDVMGDEGRGLLREFFARRLQSEYDNNVPVKETVLWQILAETIPGFKDIDYDGHLEFIVELGGYILARVMKDPGVGKDFLMDGFDDVPEYLFEQTMYYLDTSNVLKLFSLMGLIPQSYYYEGQLMKYDPPIKMYYFNKNVQYYDYKIVERIAPHWRVAGDGISQAVVGIKREALRVRKLDEGEERRLANQVRMGNKAAEEVLVRAHLRNLLDVARRASFRVSKIMAVPVEEEGLYSEGQEILMGLVSAYAVNEVYEAESLTKYLVPRLFARVYSAAFVMAEEKKGLILDDPVYDNKKESRVSRISVEADQLDGLRMNEAEQALRGILFQLGFSENEIVLLMLDVLEGYDEKQLADELSFKEGRQSTEQDLLTVRSLLDRFRIVMGNVGEEAMRDLLEGESDDRAQSPGGIDLSGRMIDLDIHKEEMLARAQMIRENKKSLQLPSFTGLSPVILAVVPIASGHFCYLN